MSISILNQNVSDVEFINLIKHSTLSPIEQQLIARLENAANNIIWLENQIENMTSTESENEGYF